MSNANKKESKTFTDYLRWLFRGVLETIGRFLNRLGVRPNIITILGLIGNCLAGVLIALGELTWGGLLAMVVGPLDALDGTMARLRGEDGQYGAFIDSVTDRYSEIALFGGLLIFFYRTGTWLDAFLVFFAALGSVMVSYVRARAEALGFSAKIGLLTRVERYVVLIPGIIFKRPDISLWILAILTHLTAIQRFWFVRRQAKEKRLDQVGKKEMTDERH
jgi:CDP-diacylglycerol--glycerol-3-phosphate 3-phosphatidyltransferase